MNREIKFRVWNPTYGMFDPEDIWQMTTFSYRKGDAIIHEQSYPPETIFMQYTGHKDKNGQEIYEGDIFGSEALRCVVEREEDGAYKLRFKDSRIKSISILDHKIKSSMIIGNIYENPEIL